MRIGHGFDIHVFGKQGPLIIGGVKIPYHKNLLSYSDGDVLIHAIIDALLGAAALGDIGNIFSCKNPEFRNIDSRKLLRKTKSLIKEKGFYICNIDATIMAQSPHLSSYMSKMRHILSEDLLCNVNCINIKATTTEKIGCIGRKQGIACEAVSLISCS